MQSCWSFYLSIVLCVSCWFQLLFVANYISNFIHSVLRCEHALVCVEFFLCYMWLFIHSHSCERLKCYTAWLAIFFLVVMVQNWTVKVVHSVSLSSILTVTMTSDVTVVSGYGWVNSSCRCVSTMVCHFTRICCSAPLSSLTSCTPRWVGSCVTDAWVDVHVQHWLRILKSWNSFRCWTEF